jgi:hypothetical protein
MELFQNISINEIRAFWFVRKLGFKGFEGRPRVRTGTYLVGTTVPYRTAVEAHVIKIHPFCRTTLLRQDVGCRTEWPANHRRALPIPLAERDKSQNDHCQNRVTKECPNYI